MKAKSKLHDGTSFNAELVAKGEIELAIQQISEIVPVKAPSLPARCQPTSSSQRCLQSASAPPLRSKPRHGVH